MNATPRTYEESFASWMPFYTKRWTSRSDLDQLHFAEADILDTLKKHENARTVYTGKLYAELDAIRDALLGAVRAAQSKRAR